MDEHPCNATSAKAHGFYNGSLRYNVEKCTELLLKAEESALWFVDDDYA